MNEYKLAWLSQQAIGYGQSRAIQRMMPKQKQSKKITGSQVVNLAARQKAEGMMMAGGYQLAKHASQSMLKGKAGMALRLTGKVGVRAIPIVGAAMLAYDIYSLGKWLMED